MDFGIKIVNIDEAIQKFADMGKVGKSVVGKVWVDNEKMDGEDYPVYQEYGFIHYQSKRYVPPKYYMRGAADRTFRTLDREIKDYIIYQHSRNKGLELKPLMSKLVENTYRYAYTLAPEDTAKLRKSISVEVK